MEILSRLLSHSVVFWRERDWKLHVWDSCSWGLSRSYLGHIWERGQHHCSGLIFSPTFVLVSSMVFGRGLFVLVVPYSFNGWKHNSFGSWRCFCSSSPPWYSLVAPEFVEFLHSSVGSFASTTFDIVWKVWRGPHFHLFCSVLHMSSSLITPSPFICCL